MTYNRILGLVLLVVGALLLYFGFQASESISDQVQETVTGKFSDSTMWYLITGAVAAVAGAALLIRVR
jgi:uncharacterized membrane protein